MKIGAVVPVKNFDNAKQRLAGALSPVERRQLCQIMLEDVLDELAEVPGLSDLLLVSREPAAAVLAARTGARVVAEPANEGQSAAAERGARALAAAGADAMLQLPGDIPGVRAAEIMAVIAAHTALPKPGATLVPAHDRRGTNCVLCSPPGVLPFAFGHESFVPHCDAARAEGLALRILELPGIALDLDTPEDLGAFLDSPVKSRTRTYLRESGIARHLQAPAVTDAA